MGALDTFKMGNGWMSCMAAYSGHKRASPFLGGRESDTLGHRLNSGVSESLNRSVFAQIEV